MHILHVCGLTYSLAPCTNEVMCGNQETIILSINNCTIYMLGINFITCDEQELFFCKMIIRGDVTHDTQLFGVVTDE